MVSMLAQSFMMPVQASDYAAYVDWLFYFIFWVSTVSFVAVIAAMVYFVVRYRAPLGTIPEKSPSHNTPLELLWSGIPLVLVLVMFWIGLEDFIRMNVAPQGPANEVTVVGSRWNFEFRYPNGASDKDLIVPLGEPTVLRMRSNDVIHSLFIPAFRIKRDLVPGRYSTVWFRPIREGEYILHCTEYCGAGQDAGAETKGHSEMNAIVRVLPRVEYERKLNRIGTVKDPIEAGKRLFSVKGCSQCHSVDGSANTGPTWQNLYDNPEHFVVEGGQQVRINPGEYDNYIRVSIRNPGAQLVKGFQNQMSAYPPSMLSDVEIERMIWYMRSISEHYPKENLAQALLGATSQPSSGPAAGQGTESGPTN